MQYIRIYVLSVILFTVPCFAADLVTTLIEKEKVLTTSLYEQNQLTALAEQITAICDKPSVTKGKKQASADIKKLKTTIKKRSISKQLEYTRDQYLIYIAKISSLTKSTSTESCSTIVNIVDVLGFLRDTHITLLEQTELIKDFGSLDTKELYGKMVKKEILQSTLDRLQPYISSDLVRFQISNTLLNDEKDAAKKEIYTLETDIMKATIIKKLVDMQRDGLLQESDLKQFKEKVILEFTSSCSNFHGSYKVKETYTSQNKLVRQDVEQMKILVNLCGNYHIIKNIGTLFEKIVTHELGHHIFYQKDSNRTSFAQICRSAKNKNICSSDAFVSNYAKTSSIEDYAEQFMHSYLGIVPDTKNATLIKKDQYFKDLFKKYKK